MSGYSLNDVVRLDINEPIIKFPINRQWPSRIWILLPTVADKEVTAPIHPLPDSLIEVATSLSRNILTEQINWSENYLYL